ncbi:hypothetical protein GCM10027162_36320 [Streptomyces incanus]
MPVGRRADPERTASVIHEGWGPDDGAEAEGFAVVCASEVRRRCALPRCGGGVRFRGAAAASVPNGGWRKKESHALRAVDGDDGDGG